MVLAAGMGTRVGADVNKAYLSLAGRPMVTWSVTTVASLPEIARTVVVYRRGEREQVERLVRDEIGSAPVEFVPGGDTRHGSERNVLEYLAADIEAGHLDVVLIHDAARPLAGPEMMRTALRLAREYGGALPALPTTDVIRVGTAAEPLRPDASLVRVQTPQAFRALPLLQAFRAADRDGFEGTDTSSCVERYADLTVRTFPGRLDNLKVTYPHDIALAERLLAERLRSSPGRR